MGWINRYDITISCLFISKETVGLIYSVEIIITFS